MTKFKYCVHCENEPAVCFDTEVDAMKFARECADACSCVKVEKSEIGEDGEILNNEVIWAADCDGNIEREIVSDNEFDTEFPASDIENVDISDDVDYDEIAKQYKEYPTDWIDDSKLIKEAVDALEENESEVECKCCFDVFPKESCVKTEKGYICKKCNQELHSHQGTNLDLIDSDPFSLDYEDPRDFDEPEEIEVKDEPVDANEVRKHEKAINEELKVIIDFSDYKPWSGAVDTYELIKDADKLDELEAYFEELYPDGITATQINDILWFDGEEVLKYLGLGDAEDEEIDESLTEDVLTEFTPIAPHPVLYKEIDKAYGNDGGFLITKRRKGKNESEAAKKTNDITDAIKFVKELAKNKDIAEIHLQIVKTSKDILIYKDGKETFNKIVEVGKNLQAENKTRVGGDTISDIDELRDSTKKDLEKLFADIANNYKEAEQEQIKEILQDYAKKLRACTTKDEVTLLDAVNKAKTDIDNLKLKTKAEYEAEETANKDTSSEETADKESNDNASTDNTTSTTKIKTDAAAAALKNAYPNNDKQIRIVLSMLKKANLTEDIDENLEEDKKVDELPADPEAAKLEVHTMLNDLVADEIEAINGYDDAKAQIIDTPIEHKDNILDTIDHIKGEEQEHIDELIDATTEIPFDKEETHDFTTEEESLAEDTHAKYAKPEGDRIAAYNNALKYAKKENKPFIYGYTNHVGKFFAAETPMKVTGRPVDAEKEFRSRYKNCNAIYVVYPDKDFIDENLKEEKINIDYVVSLFGDGSHYYKEKEDYNDVPLSPNISGATKFNKKKDISILDIVKDVCEYSAKYMPENEAASLFDLDTLEEVYEKDEDYFINSGLVEIISVFKLPESLEEAKEELPADPEAAKLEVHTMLNDLVADEIEAINGYDDAKAEIMDTPIAHKDNILDTIDHIKGEEQEHIDELIDATTEIPFDKEEETPAPEIEEPFNQDFPEVDEESEEKSLTETKAKPEGDKVKSYNDGLKLAKLHSKPVIYGYTNSSYGNKFFALDDPIVCDNVSDEAKKFRRQYKSCNVVYVAYPNDQFVED